MPLGSIELLKIESSCVGVLFVCAVCNKSCQSGGFDYESRHAGVSAVWWHDSIY